MCHESEFLRSNRKEIKQQLHSLFECRPSAVVRFCERAVRDLHGSASAGEGHLYHPKTVKACRIDGSADLFRGGHGAKPEGTPDLAADISRSVLQSSGQI